MRFRSGRVTAPSASPPAVLNTFCRVTIQDVSSFGQSVGGLSGSAGVFFIHAFGGTARRRASDAARRIACCIESAWARFVPAMSNAVP